jgi:cell wall-associated NlpC family hydrolase
LRVRALDAVLCSSLVALVAAAGPSVAGAAGSLEAGAMGAPIETSASGGSAPTSPAKPTSSTPATPAHHAPVTAPTPNITYTGPVYEQTAAGQLVPYVSPAAVARANKATDSATGGSVVGAIGNAKPELLVPGHLAKIVDGLAAAPEDAPAAVKQILWAANTIVGLPYIYGGGHASFVSPGYDCSGTVSYALHGAELLAAPMDSSEFMGWQQSGIGAWVTIFANGGHAYMTVAGVRLDTSSADDPSNLQGPRWRPLRQSNEGYAVRHPLGL